MENNLPANKEPPTPLQTMRQALDDEKYYPVLEACAKAEEIPGADKVWEAAQACAEKAAVAAAEGKNA